MVAGVQPRADGALDELASAVRSAVAEEIGLTPADVCLLMPGTLARTSSGKLMRRDARDRYLAGDLDASRAVRQNFPLRLMEAARGAFVRFVARRRLPSA